MIDFYIGFSRNREDAPFSVLLQDYMGKKYSHVYVKYRTKMSLGDNAIYHSSMSGGVSLMSEIKFSEHNIEERLYKVQISPDASTKIKRELFNSCGDKYAMWQNIGIIAIDFIRSFGIKCKNPFTKGQNCSELVYRHVIQNIFEDMEGEYDPETIRPDHVEAILIEKGCERIL